MVIGRISLIIGLEFIWTRICNGRDGVAIVQNNKLFLTKFQFIISNTRHGIKKKWPVNFDFSLTKYKRSTVLEDNGILTV